MGTYLWFYAGRKRLFILIAVFIILLLVSCNRGSHPAVEVVEKYYNAFSANDINTLMDTIAPDDRSKTGIGLINLLESLSFSLGGLGLDIGSLASYSVSDMKYELVSKNDDYALVRAEGGFRNTAMGIEVPMCDLLDVRRESDKNWYIDIDAPERMQRMTGIQTTQQEKLMALLNSGDASVGVFGDMAEVMAIYMNMCE